MQHYFITGTDTHTNRIELIFDLMNHENDESDNYSTFRFFNRKFKNKTQETIDVIEELLVKAEKSEFESKQFSDYKDQFQWFVGFGLLFLLMDMFLL